MTSIRVWNLESDHDPQVVKFLEDEFVNFRKLGELTIRTAGRSALRRCHRKGAPLKESLKSAIQYYLAQDDYVIFIVDSDQQHQGESIPLADQLRCVVKDYSLSNRVFFAPEVQEYNASTPIQWKSIVSRFHTEVESEHKRFQEKWDKTMERFHDAFADTPEEEVIRDFEEALAEVRRERT